MIGDELSASRLGAPVPLFLPSPTTLPPPPPPQGSTLRYVSATSPLSDTRMSVLYGFLPGSGWASPVRLKMPHTPWSLQACLKIAASGPSVVVVKSAHLVGWNPCMSGGVMRGGRLL